ncbi:MAG: DNA-directed RNA polymerase subunit delta [Bacillota bacterium]
MAKYSYADLAYRILREAQRPLPVRQLLEQVVAEQQKNEGQLKGSLPQLMASAYTEINLDQRFVHLGEGLWSIRELVGTRTTPDDSWDI